MGTLHKLTVAVAWVLWCTLPALATPEENGDFTMDLWASPGGSVYVVAFTRLFTPPALMETVLMRYLPNGQRVETHHLPGGGHSYTLSGMLVPARNGRGFFILSKEGSDAWIACYLSPAQCLWTYTYKAPGEVDFRYEAGIDASGNLYVLVRSFYLPTPWACLLKLGANGKLFFTRQIDATVKHLLVTTTGHSYVLCTDRLIHIAPDGKVRWQRSITALAEETSCLLLPGNRIALLDWHYDSAKARLRLLAPDGKLLSQRSVQVPLYHDEHGLLYSYEIHESRKGNRLTVFGYDLAGRRVWQASAPVRFSIEPNWLSDDEDNVLITKDQWGHVYFITSPPDLTVLKWDARGRLIYHRQIPLRREAYETLPLDKVVVDTQGNLYVGSTAWRRNSADLDSVLVKISAQGKMEWMRAYNSGLRRVRR